MNSLEAEYSFLAPTWKLPTVATTSMYSRTYGTPYISNTADLGPDWTLWNNTMYNSRYIPSYVPSTTFRRNYPVTTNQKRIIPSVIPVQQQNYQIPGGPLTQSDPGYYQQQINNQYGNNINPEDGLNLTISLHPNHEYGSHNNISNYGPSKQQAINRGLTYATSNQNNPQLSNQKRRVQIIDHSRQTPSTVNNEYLSDRNSKNSNNVHSYSQHNRTPDPHKSQQKSKFPVSNQNQNQNQNQHQHHEHNDDANKHGYVGNNYNIHEYLYGLSAPDPGSYVDAFKHHQRRLQDEKLGRKSVMSEYKNFAQNGGFGPTFGNADYQTHHEKIDSDKKKKTYSKGVREINQYKIEEQKRYQNNHDPRNNGTAPVPKHQRPVATRPHFLSAQEAREYAEKIEKPHHMKPVSQIEFPSRISIISPILIRSLTNIQRHSSLDTIHSSKINDSLLNKLNINQTRRSSSLPSITRKRRIRFHNYDFIRHPSNTFIDLPSHIIGTNIPFEKDSLSTCNSKRKLTSKILDEKKPKQINNFKNSLNHTLQSILNKNEKKFITSRSMMMIKNMRLPPTASVIINQTYKPSLTTITSTNNNSKVSTSNKCMIPSQRSLTTHSIPGPFRKTKLILKPNIDLDIKSYHHTSNNDSSNK